MKDEFNERGGFNGSFTLGKRPALVVVDFQKGFTQPEVSPLASECESVLIQTNAFISAFRQYGPVFFTTTGYSEGFVQAGVWIEKCLSLNTLLLGTPACEIDPLLEVDTSSDTVIQKTQASAFFGTPFGALLSKYGCNSLLVVGCTTSGCVRATVLDSVANGFRTFVVKDCVTDRSQRQHESNLIDMQSKYAEVLLSHELLKQLSATRC